MPRKAPPKPQTAETPESLEKTVEELEEIVQKLESGDVDLEKSIALYERGRTLGGQALKRLEALERRIQLVTGDDEELTTEDFQEDDEQ